jgi:hypothetical protein
MDVLGAAPLELLIRLLSSSLRSPTDGERVDAWAVRIALWRGTIPDLRAPVNTLPGYVDCGVFASSAHLLGDHSVRVYIIWLAAEAMPYTVYQQLARQGICDDTDCRECTEEPVLEGWMKDMRSRDVVIALRLTNLRVR